MNVLILGAMGKTGRAVLEQAVAAGHEVTAFVHNANLAGGLPARVVQGDATRRTDVDAAMRGQEAVVDTIGGKTPWKHTTLERTVAQCVIASMQAHQVRRLLAISMLGVGGSKAHASLAVRLLVPTFLRGADRDKSAMEDAVRCSGLDWTILRPAILTDGAVTGDIRVLQDAVEGKVHNISRLDVAAFVIAQLSATNHLHQSITIATK